MLTKVVAQQKAHAPNLILLVIQKRKNLMKWVDEELPPLQDITTQSTSNGEDYFTIPNLCSTNLINLKVQKPKCRARKKTSIKEVTHIQSWVFCCRTIKLL